MSTHEVMVGKDHVEQAVQAADLLARAIVQAVDERGIARVALSGGSTPGETYRRLASLPLPFDRVEWFWVDERGVPPDHPRSNYGAAAKDLLLADGKHGRAHRMEGERGLDVAAADYEALLRRSFGVASAVAFDAMTMGVGDDGHTASLFPRIGAVNIEDRLVAHVVPPPAEKLEDRITLTRPVILEARLSVVIVHGEDKRPVIALARTLGDEDEVPSRILLHSKGRVVWALDRAAAGP
jgi:6-phosphogluconolactonase